MKGQPCVLLIDFYRQYVPVVYDWASREIVEIFVRDTTSVYSTSTGGAWLDKAKAEAEYRLSNGVPQSPRYFNAKALALKVARPHANEKGIPLWPSTIPMQDLYGEVFPCLLCGKSTTTSSRSPEVCSACRSLWLAGQVARVGGTHLIKETIDVFGHKRIERESKALVTAMLALAGRFPHPATDAELDTASDNRYLPLAIEATATQAAAWDYVGAWVAWAVETTYARGYLAGASALRQLAEGKSPSLDFESDLDDYRSKAKAAAPSAAELEKENDQ